MQFVTDLHLHSKYSRAVSPQMTLPVMAQYAAQKGIDILSAADFTHPVWFKEMQNLLQEAEEGMYTLKETTEKKEIRFLLSTEISSIYKQGDKLRRIHNLIFVPSLEIAEKVNKELVRRGCNITADGRPIVGISSKNLLEMILSIDERCYLIPCHIWTPHFGIYGSASGFDSLEEAFGELAPQVFGIETGLSSDPDMNWQVKELMHRSVLSFSDAHSPAKMSREATVLELESPTYENIRQAFMRLSQKNPTHDNKIAYTLEFYPEEGKYHFSGHRNCKVVQGPEEIRASGNRCPVCKRRLTEGVLYRVQELADPTLLTRAQEKKNTEGVKWYTDSLHIQPPYVKLVPLLEIVAESLGSTVMSMKSKDLYAKICRELDSELAILLKTPIDDIRQVGGEVLAEGIVKVRGGELSIDPGYDGIFGKVAIWTAEEKKENKLRKGVPQLRLGF
jgi:uncharacterized protein (TIGR00375 family)